MSLFFADEDNITFGVQGSNEAEVAHFSSTLDHVYMRMFTNNNSDIENLTSGVVIGSSNYDKTTSARNNLYFGHINSNETEIQRVMIMEQNRVGINTAPSATFHVVGSNLAYSNVLRVDTINSPMMPALVIDKYGYVGIGTEPVNQQDVTIKGTLFVDNIRVGGFDTGDDGKLITAYGMAPPAGACNTLTFNNAVMSNISEVVTPTVTATNLEDQFRNVANYTYLNYATMSIGSIAPTGAVPFTTTFKGNSTSYTYTISTSNVATGAVSSHAQRTINNVSTATDTVTYATGTYHVNLTASTPGTGTGSSWSSNHITEFVVPITDNIGAPSVTLASGASPTFSTNNLVYVSGIPYYGNGTNITFGSNTMTFGNIYNTIDPRTALTNVLTLKDGTHNANLTNFTYGNVFTNVLTANTSNNFPLSMSLTSTTNPALTALYGTVYNINNQSGVQNTSLVTGIAYLGASVDETNMEMATYTNMPISSVRRMSMASGAAVRERPNISTELSAYTSGQSHDAWYSPYNNGEFYQTFASIPRGTYKPSYTPGGGEHAFVCLKITTTAPLSSFVLNLGTSSSVTINSVWVNWASINNGANWYSAKVLYTDGGCAGSTYTNGNLRFPITLPVGQSLNTNSIIYINIYFSGSISKSALTLSYT